MHILGFIPLTANVHRMCLLHHNGRILNKHSKYIFIMLLLLTILNFTPCLSMDVQPQKERYLPDYNVYHNISYLYRDIHNIANRYPGFVKLDQFYMSQKQNSQIMVRLSNFTDHPHVQTSKNVDNKKIKLFFSYGEHAREFFPVESMMYLLKNITMGLSASHEDAAYRFSRTVLSNFDIFIIGMANPDGRLYIERTKNYCWRGTDSGVDLERNFDWEFGEKGSSNDPNDEEYRGKYPFSEPETKVYTKLTELHKFDVFISFHSGARQIYIPYSDTRSKEIRRHPENIDNMLRLANAMFVSSSAKFENGLSYTLSKYNADGSIFDYMAGVKKIPYSYTIELWGNSEYEGSSCFDIFNPRSEDIKESLEAVHPIYVTMFEYLINWKNPVPMQSFPQIKQSNDPSITFGYLVMFVVIIMILSVVARYRCPRPVGLRNAVWKAK